jgi:hypothetical protein
MSEWSFLTNHARVLACIALDPEVTLRDVASTLNNITERTIFSTIDDLILAGYVTKEREGRGNRYHIQVDAPLDEPIGREQTIGDLLKFLVGPQSARSSAQSGLERADNRDEPFSHGRELTRSRW